MSARKGRSKEVCPLIHSAGTLVTTTEEKAELLKNFFTTVFNGNPSSLFRWMESKMGTGEAISSYQWEVVTDFLVLHAHVAFIY